MAAAAVGKAALALGSPGREENNSKKERTFGETKGRRSMGRGGNEFMIAWPNAADSPRRRKIVVEVV